MSTHAQIPAPPPGMSPPAAARRAAASPGAVGDRIGVALAWAAGILLCLIAAAIVLYMLVPRPPVPELSDLLVSHPAGRPRPEQDAAASSTRSIGTVILTVLGTAIAAPLGVGIAVWLTEYGRPAWLARAVESGVEIVAGTPSIVLAIFGLLIFQQSFFSFLSFTAEGDAVFGRSFFTAGAMMSLIALPLIVGATREALQSIPAPRPRGLLRARQGPDLDDPPRAAAGLAARDRHRGHPRHGPDRRRHRDRRHPARRHAAASSPRAALPVWDLLQRHRQHADHLRLQQLARPARAARPRRPTRPPSCC